MYNTCYFEKVNILANLVNWTKLELGKKGSKFGQNDGAFFLVVPKVYLKVCAKF